MLSAGGIVDGLEAEGVLDFDQVRVTVSVGAVAANAVYTVRFTFDTVDIDIETDAGASPTPSSVAIAIADNIANNAIVGAFVSVSTLGTDILLEALAPGTPPWTFSESEAALSTTQSTFVDTTSGSPRDNILSTYGELVGGVRSDSLVATPAHNYNLPTGTGAAFVRASVWRVDGGAVPVQISGFQRNNPGTGTDPAFRRVFLVNIGTSTITLLHENANSDAANRIIGAGGASLVLPAGDSACLLYDAVTQRWRVVT